MSHTSLNATHILERIRTFNSSLDRLMRLYTGDTVSSTEFSGILTEEACSQLGVERVSVWALDKDWSKITCVDLYLTDGDQHLSDITIFAKDVPRYFEAVLAERVIAANDACLDPRTTEFTEAYLKPNRIISMLDAQIRSAGGPRGVICIETVDIQRDWSPDEIAYAVSVAELLGFFMDREDRRRVLAQLEETNERLALAVATAEEAHERYDLAVKAAFDGVWDFDLVSTEIFFSEQNFSLLGEPSKGAPPNGFDWWESRVHVEDRERVAQAFQSHIENDTPYNETYRIWHSDKSLRWWRSRGQAVRDKTGKAVRVVGTNSDVTDLIRMQTELEKRNQQLLSAKKEIEGSALHDALTGLPNRRYLDQISREILQNQKYGPEHLSVLHIDLDFFKDVNDKFGHAIGDQTLKRVAKILTSLADEGEFVARIGGDEFIAVLFDTASADRAVEFSTGLNMLLDHPFKIDGAVFEMGASIGVSVCPNENIDVWYELGNADIALYEAKKGGRCTYRIFDEKMRKHAAFVRDTKADLALALRDQTGIIPFFQPQFSAKTFEVTSFEVLARWNHPTRGILTPDQFITFAQEMNCLEQIDRQILARSVECLREWRANGLDIPRLSVNVSSERLQDPELLSSVINLGEDAKKLSFELLETTFLDDTSDRVKETLNRVRELGVELEIDDFGSGYASILSLINIRPRRLKIDRSLIRGVALDNEMSSLVQSIVDIARTFNIEVVAEGVETSEQIAILVDIGCDVLQGFGLAKPMSYDAIIATFQDRGKLSLRRVGGMP